ncbi:MAG: hypothetical protein DCC48_06180 [Acidobacteria bacterium]|nr:MAG: hypothetical protein DCC48_06180 [Acidobacteriota bacterium]
MIALAAVLVLIGVPASLSQVMSPPVEPGAGGYETLDAILTWSLVGWLLVGIVVPAALLSTRHVVRLTDESLLVAYLPWYFRRIRVSDIEAVWVFPPGSRRSTLDRLVNLGGEERVRIHCTKGTHRDIETSRPKELVAAIKRVAPAGSGGRP